MGVEWISVYIISLEIPACFSLHMVQTIVTNYYVAFKNPISVHASKT